MREFLVNNKTFAVTNGQELVALNPDIKLSGLRATLLCAWRDSNPHALRHQILSLARLPITPHAHFFLTLFLEFAAKPQKSLICNQKGSANLEIIRYD